MVAEVAVEIITICALTIAAPYYDCSSEWVIEFYYETKDLGDIGVCKKPDSPNGFTTGCARYNYFEYMDNILTPTIRVGTYSGIDEWGYTTLQHELEHLKCRCIWEGHP